MYDAVCVLKSGMSLDKDIEEALTENMREDLAIEFSNQHESQL